MKYFSFLIKLMLLNWNSTPMNVASFEPKSSARSKTGRKVKEEEGRADGGFDGGGEEDVSKIQISSQKESFEKSKKERKMFCQTQKCQNVVKVRS